MKGNNGFEFTCSLCWNIYSSIFLACVAIFIHSSDGLFSLEVTIANTLLLLFVSVSLLNSDGVISASLFHSCTCFYDLTGIKLVDKSVPEYKYNKIWIFFNQANC